MATITIEISDDTYALLQRRAEAEWISLEEETVQMVERSLAMTLPGGIERWREFRTAITTIKGFISTLLLDDDGTMFIHTDRMEFFEVIDKECDRLKESADAVSLRVHPVERFCATPTSLRAVLEAVRDRALASPHQTSAHIFRPELGEGLPEIFLTDQQALINTLGTFLEDAMVQTTGVGEIRFQIRRMQDDGLFFAICHTGSSLSSEFAQKFVHSINAVPISTSVVAGPHLFDTRHFINWHGGTFDATWDDLTKTYTVSFTLPPIYENNPLNTVPLYRNTLAQLRQFCLHLLAEAEKLPRNHTHFDDHARNDLVQRARAELEQMQAFLVGLQTTDTSLIP